MLKEIAEKVDDLHKFGEFLSLLAALSAQEINYSQLGRDIGITPQTAKRWLFALGASYQWREALPLFKNNIKKLSEKRKGYLTDSGLACQLLRIRSPEDLSVHPSLGHLFETWAINSITQLFASLPIAPALYHWRTHSGAEVDLVLEWNGTYFPIKIKCSHNLTGYDLRGFKAFREAFAQQKVAPGLIYYGGNESYRLNASTLALPWKILN